MQDILEPAVLSGAIATASVLVGVGPAAAGGMAAPQCWSMVTFATMLVHRTAQTGTYGVA